MKWFVDSLRVEYGAESETLLIDIVRHVVVNVFQDDRARKSPVLQRYVLIAGIVNSQKHEIHQSLVLQALFIDWLFFEE